MYTRISLTLILSAAVALMATLAPTTAFADETTDAEPSVTLEEMTTDDTETTEDSEETLQQSTFQQNGDGDNPGLARTVGLNALWGGIAGGLIGLGFYLVTGMDTTPWVIAQFAGGGLLVGGTVGLITGLATAEPDPDTRAHQQPDSVDYVEQHAPETIDVNLMRQQF